MIPLPPDAPIWMQVLWSECDRTSQAACARRLRLCPATICQVLKGTYQANTRRVEARVLDLLIPEAKPCPVLGLIPTTRCLDEQKAPYFPDPIRSALSKACPVCPYSKNRKEPAP